MRIWKATGFSLRYSSPLTGSMDMGSLLLSYVIFTFLSSRGLDTGGMPHEIALLFAFCLRRREHFFGGIHAAV